MFYRTFVLIAVFLFRNFSRSQLVGDDCIRRYDNSHGVCRPAHQCPRAVEEYNSKRIPLTQCSFLDGESIICCPEMLERISVQKCNEYRKFATKKIYVWGLLLTQSEPSSINTSNCDFSTPLIVGGSVTKTGEFPHLAAIGWRKTHEPSFECAGSLISELFVLTAAHCEKSDGIRPAFVRLGDQNLRSKNDHSHDIDRNIAQFIRHPEYSSRTDKNDIALIKLENSVSFSNFIRPACLWQTEKFNFTKAIATGWGALEYGTEASEELMKVELELIENEKCNQLLSYSISLSRERYLDNRQICSGILKGGKDTCTGDSGGPLQVVFNSSECLYHIIGITSYGSRLCGSANSPGVYTSVSAYIDWIERNVWDA